MNELSIEQKSKRYDEAIKAAKSLCKITTSLPMKEYMESIFPELKESEDERIRKALIDRIECFNEKHMLFNNGVSKNKVIAWLEKQGEHPTTIPKWKYKKDNAPLLRDSLILNKYGCVAKSPSGALVSDVWVIDYDELAKLPKEESEKQGEQKPADKIEPIFNVGDKIQYSKGCGTIMTIEKIENGEYIFADNMGHTTIESGNKWHLVNTVEQNPAWSEEDERIVTELIGIFESAVDGGHVTFPYRLLKDCIRVLKSCLPQSQWKPSDEQIYVLDEVIRNPHLSTAEYNGLIVLKEQLKAL